MFLQDPYMLKALEYLLGVVFLILFAGFWKYATGGRTAAAAQAHAHAPAPHGRRRRDVHWPRPRIRRARVDLEPGFAIHRYARADRRPRRRLPRVVDEAHSIS
jgi:hypothetical protein